MMNTQLMGRVKKVPTSPLDRIRARAEVLFDHSAQNDTQNDGRQRKVHLLQHIARDTGNDHHVHVVEAAVAGVSTHEAEGEDQGQQDLLGDIQHPGPQPDTGKAQDTHQKVRHKQTHEQHIYTVLMLGEQQRAGGQTQHGQGTQHDRRTGVAGNTHGQQRDEGAAGDGVVAAFGGRNALRGTVA